MSEGDGSDRSGLARIIPRRCSHRHGRGGRGGGEVVVDVQDSVGAQRDRRDEWAKCRSIFMRLAVVNTA